MSDTRHEGFPGLPASDHFPKRDPGDNSGIHPLFKALGIVLLVIVAYFVIRWAATEYYITTHCTTVLGTRVCQQ